MDPRRRYPLWISRQGLITMSLLHALFHSGKPRSESLNHSCAGLFNCACVSCAGAPSDFTLYSSHVTSRRSSRLSVQVARGPVELPVALLYIKVDGRCPRCTAAARDAEQRAAAEAHGPADGFRRLYPSAQLRHAEAVEPSSASPVECVSRVK